MQHIFIINPHAGKKKSTRLLEQSIQALDVPHEVIFTKKAGDARRIAQLAAESGEDVRLYACGGDGTLNEVVNGAAGFANAAVTNVPMGTGNDFLKIFGKDARQRFLDLPALSVGPQAAMDLIDCGGRLGIDIACTGLDARVADDVDRYKKLPLVGGIGAYILALVENVFKGISRPAVVDVGDLHFDGELAILTVCSGRYYGGGFMPVGDNMPDDGQLEVLLVPKVGLPTLARLIGKYAKGKYRDYPDLIQYRQENRAVVRSDREMVAVVDGEVMRGKEFVFRLSEKKVNFFYPADVDYSLPR